MKCLIVPPALGINKILYKNNPMPAHVKLEQRIVWNLLLVLEKAGFVPHFVDDGDEQTSAHSKIAAMELLFNLDDAHIFFTHKSKERLSEHQLRTVWVRLVFGNGVDVVSDYNAVDWNGFSKVMDKFDAEVYA